MELASWHDNTDDTDTDENTYDYTDGNSIDTTDISVELAGRHDDTDTDDENTDDNNVTTDNTITNDNTDISMELAGRHLWSEQTRLQSGEGSLRLMIMILLKMPKSGSQKGLLRAVQ